MTTKSLASTLAAAAVLAAAALRTFGGDAQPSAGEPTPTVTVATETPAAPLPASGAVITFPDGSTRPTLNGVDEAVRLQWSNDRAYAPVVEIVKDGEREWFRHADGSFSTTLRLLDQATGKYMTVCPLYERMPGPPKGRRLRN